MAEPPYSIDEFWNIVGALAADMQRSASALEAVASDEELEDRGKWFWFWRRMCALNVFEMIEGTIYHMTYIAYVARYSRDVVFSLDELEVLENAYDFDEEGDVEPGLTLEPMLERIKFAFNAFARVHYSDYILPISDEGWAQMKEVFAIKETISHPQTTAELEVFDDNVTDLLQATAWFMQCLVALIESCRDSAGARVASWEDEKDGPVM
jgi:hypothetical protein